MPKVKNLRTPEQQEQFDKLIIAAYTSPKRGRGAVKRLKNQLNCTQYAIYSRSLQLGLITEPRKRQPEWTEAENRILEQEAHNNPIKIRKKLVKHGFTGRTPNAITTQLKKIGITLVDARIAAGIYSSRQAAQLMGVNPYTINSYINRGMLKAEREPDDSNRYRITWTALRDLIVNYVAEINIAKIDKFWLIDIFTGKWPAL